MSENTMSEMALPGWFQSPHGASVIMYGNHGISGRSAETVHLPSVRISEAIRELQHTAT